MSEIIRSVTNSLLGEEDCLASELFREAVRRLVCNFVRELGADRGRVVGGEVDVLTFAEEQVEVRVEQAGDQGLAETLEFELAVVQGTEFLRVF